jgi:hypothetical protein
MYGFLQGVRDIKIVAYYRVSINGDKVVWDRCSNKRADNLRCTGHLVAYGSEAARERERQHSSRLSRAKRHKATDHRALDRLPGTCISLPA